MSTRAPAKQLPPPPEPPDDEPDPILELQRRLVPGGAFIHDAPDTVPTVWGHEKAGDVLWSEDEPLIITGPTGVGKTTLGGQVVNARLGLQKKVLGYPVTPGQRRVLYLAMDRPAQIRRALARIMRKAPRETLDERLVVWAGPPPMDLARNPRLLLELAEMADADTVVIDSLKDAAVKLSDEETGQGINLAMQKCVTEHIQVIAYHHQTKRGGNGDGSKPKTLADVYGSAWITAGCGSVILLWGAAGDPIVELVHLKQPSNEVGPLKLVHDNIAGTTAVFEGTDVMSLLLAGPATAREVAEVLFSTEKPTDAEVQKARRKLEQLVRSGKALRVADAGHGGGKDGGKGGSTGARYAATAEAYEVPPDDDDGSTNESLGSADAAPENPRKSTHGSTNGRGPAGIDQRGDDRPTLGAVSAGRSTNASTNAPDAPIDPRTHPPLRGGVGRSDDGTDDFDGCVLANVTTTPRPVGSITTDVSTLVRGASAFDVQAALERLATDGSVAHHAAAGNGPPTWSLPTGTTAA